MSETEVRSALEGNVLSSFAGQAPTPRWYFSSVGNETIRGLRYPYGWLFAFSFVPDRLTSEKGASQHFPLLALT